MMSKMSGSSNFVFCFGECCLNQGFHLKEISAVANVLKDLKVADKWEKLQSDIIGLLIFLISYIKHDIMARRSIYFIDKKATFAYPSYFFQNNQINIT